MRGILREDRIWSMPMRFRFDKSRGGLGVYILVLKSNTIMQIPTICLALVISYPAVGR